VLAAEQPFQAGEGCRISRIARQKIG